MTYRANHEFNHVATLEQDLSPDGNKIANLLSDAMTQCRRLQGCHDLFPSVLAKDEFFEAVKTLYAPYADATASGGQHWSEQNDNDPSTDGDVLFGDLEDQSVDNNMPPPPFFPDMPNGKHPWNNWLDNSAQAMPGWVAIEQRVPRYGIRLIRRLEIMYDAAERMMLKVCHETDPWERLNRTVLILDT